MEKEKNKILQKLFLIKGEMGKFFRIFIFLFLITVLIINWGTIKEMFNYRAIYGEIFSSLKDSLFQDKETALKVPQVKLSKPEFEFLDRPDSLEIPKIELIAPLVFSEAAQEKNLEKLLKEGVVFYPGSALPGKEGVTIILGHSAPSSWPKINYDWVFTRLNELEPGDEILIYFEHRKYPYQVTKKFFLKRGEEIPTFNSQSQKSILILLSCWPPGIDQKRIAVQAEINL